MDSRSKRSEFGSKLSMILNVSAEACLVTATDHSIRAVPKRGRERREMQGFIFNSIDSAEFKSEQDLLARSEKSTRIFTAQSIIFLSNPPVTW